ncbi:hypothetical protein Hanom_Chr11g01064161 [Helianthus anomalus]
MVVKRLGVLCNPNSTPTLSIIFCGIQVKGEYGWRWFVLDRSRVFIDYYTVVPSGGWRTGFRASGRAKGWRRSSSRL